MVQTKSAARGNVRHAYQRIKQATKAIKEDEAAQLSLEEVAGLIRKNDGLQRTVRSLTAGSEGLEKVAAVLADMRMSQPHQAIRYARRQYLGAEYDGLPLSPLEDLMAKRGNALRPLWAYELVAPAIRQQLESARRAQVEIDTPVIVSLSAHECGGRSSRLEGNAAVGDGLDGEARR